MANFTIIIQGIGLVYMKDGLWKAIFPFGGCHQVRMKLDPSDIYGIPLAASNGLVEIKATGPKSVAERGEGLEDFVDLTAPYAHAHGIRLRDRWHEKSTVLTIESARLSLKSYTNCRYAIAGSGSAPNRFKEVGYSVKAEIVADEISIYFSGIQTDRNPMVFDSNCTIIFDNTCWGIDTNKLGDLEMLYNQVIQDKEDPKVRFKVMRDPVQNPPSHKETETESTEGQSKILDNPKPLEEGLPCNIFLGGDPESLY
jgi:hypothetical protein